MSVNNFFSNQRIKRAILYLVPTPIGNALDLSERSKNILSSADIILCEDTRVTKELFRDLKLKYKELVSCYSQIETEKGQAIIERAVKEDLILAYCSDAGSPGISDPGSILVRIALEKGLAVSAIPGPTALIPALTTSGFDTSKFIFLGFLSNKSSARISELKKYKNSDEVIIVYEAPHRMKETLLDLEKIFSKNRRVSISRELSKSYENHIYGNLEEIIKEDIKYQGECVIVIDKSHNKTDLSDEEIIRLVKESMQEGNTLSRACKQVSEEFSLSKNYVYKLCVSNNL